MEKKYWKTSDIRVAKLVLGTLNDEQFSEPLKILKKHLKLESVFDLAEMTKSKMNINGKKVNTVLDYALINP